MAIELLVFAAIFFAILAIGSLVGIVAFLQNICGALAQFLVACRPYVLAAWELD